MLRCENLVEDPATGQDVPCGADAVDVVLSGYALWPPLGMDAVAACEDCVLPDRELCQRCPEGLSVEAVVRRQIAAELEVERGRWLDTGRVALGVALAIVRSEQR